MRTHKLKNIEDLKPAPYNSDVRKIEGVAKEGLEYSMEEFGDISGITFNIRTGNLVSGHQRVDVLRAAGAKFNMDKTRLEVWSGAGGTPETFPIREVNWPIKKEKAANVAANNKYIAGDWSDGLGDMLEELKIDLGDTFEAMRFGMLDYKLNIPATNEPIEDTDTDTTANKCPSCGFAW